MPNMKRRLVELLNDDRLGDAERIEVLRHLELDSLAKERSANEGMIPVESDNGEDLKAIELALRRLGQEPVSGDRPQN